MKRKPGGTRIGACLALLWLGAACEAAGGGALLRRDSAGVRIVESRAPAWTEESGWRVANTPSLIIGERFGEPAYRLDQPFSATRLSDGRYVIANWGTRELRWFSAGGDHLFSAGGAGTTPGRFTYLSWIARIRGDTVLATDASRAQVTLFTPGGQFGRTVDLPEVTGLARFAGSVADGGLLLTISARGGSAVPTELARDSFLLVHHDPAVPRTDTLGRFAGAWSYRQNVEGGGVAAWTPPFRGYTTVATGGGRVYVANPDRDEILVYEPAGRLRGIFRRTREPRRVGDEEIRQFREFVQSTAPDEEQKRLRAEAYERIPYPETLPAFESIAADSRGRVWIQEYAFPWNVGAQRWSVLESSGEWLGTVELPRSLVVLEIGEDYVLGVWRDQGFDAIRVYEIER